jgi:hypothetical protein
MSSYSFGDPFYQRVKIEPFRCTCTKCLSTRRPIVLLKPGPWPTRWDDFLYWECVECHAQWYTETADHKPCVPVQPERLSQ